MLRLSVRGAAVITGGVILTAVAVILGTAVAVNQHLARVGIRLKSIAVARHREPAVAGNVRGTRA